MKLKNNSDTRIGTTLFTFRKVRLRIIVHVYCFQLRYDLDGLAPYVMWLPQLFEFTFYDVESWMTKI